MLEQEKDVGRKTHQGVLTYLCPVSHTPALLEGKKVKESEAKLNQLEGWKKDIFRLILIFHYSTRSN